MGKYSFILLLAPSTTTPTFIPPAYTPGTTPASAPSSSIPPVPPVTGTTGTTGTIPPVNPYGIPTPNIPPDQLNAMLNNPAMQSMMQNMLNDPNMVEMMIQMNPQLRNDPMMQQILRNPAMRSMIFNPQTLQMASQMQQMYGGAGVNPSTTPAATTTPAAGTTPSTGASNPFMFNPYLYPPQPQSNIPPRERFATQLQELKNMGFYDEEENLRVLEACHGNINIAVDRLLQQQ